MDPFRSHPLRSDPYGKRQVGETSGLAQRMGGVGKGRPRRETGKQGGKRKEDVRRDIGAGVQRKRTRGWARKWRLKTYPREVPGAWMRPEDETEPRRRRRNPIGAEIEHVPQRIWEGPNPDWKGEKPNPNLEFLFASWHDGFVLWRRFLRDP